ncbi:alpha/beta-hydrolase [Myriangium duriaei CBS 260.36]|uniref:Alpha/beta-hydrolase n=1 Tax=Myriangium duriaei CBS 260.36 TaxID=1168546 RepID=A0A9P4IVR3_9PEZI|nr:alpha/beta-hydrolase [Myriangium duriaei CBS 260.36]
MSWAFRPSTKEGDVPFDLPGIEKSCFTHYRIYGELGGDKTPLVFLHGGPGGGAKGLATFAELWYSYGIPLVTYDMIGCGESTLLPETLGDESLWQVSLFVAELNNVLDHLHLRNGFHLAGVSFGTYVACAFASRQPPGLKRLVLASGIPSKDLSVQSFQEIKDQLPSEHTLAIDEAGRTGDFKSAAYQDAWLFVIKNYMFRQDGEISAEKLDWIKRWDEQDIVKLTMSGPSPFFSLGSMAGFTNVPILHRIKAPTLIYNGDFETSSRDCAQEVFFKHIPRVRWVKFSNSGHVVHMQNKDMYDKVMKLIGGFLTPTLF